MRSVSFKKPFLHNTEEKGKRPAPEKTLGPFVLTSCPKAVYVTTEKPMNLTSHLHPRLLPGHTCPVFGPLVATCTVWRPPSSTSQKLRGVNKFIPFLAKASSLQYIFPSFTLSASTPRSVIVSFPLIPLSPP